MKEGVRKRAEAAYSDALSRHLCTHDKWNNATLTYGSTVLERVTKWDTFLTYSRADHLRNREKRTRLRAMTAVKPHV